MNPIVLNLPWLALKPDITATATRVEARTPFYARLGSAFAYERRLIVDRSQSLLSLSVRRWWFLHDVTFVPLSHVESLWYAFGSQALSYVYTAKGITDEVSSRPGIELEWFKVGLQRRDDPKPLLLYRFVGEAAIAQTLSIFAIAGTWWLRALQWMLEVLVSAQSDEEITSLQFVKALQRVIEVPVSSPMQAHVQAAMADSAVPCPNCGRTLTVDALRCVYCGTKYPQGLSHATTQK